MTPLGTSTAASGDTQTGNLAALPTAVVFAEGLIHHGDHDAARQLLGEALTGFEPSTAPRDPRLAGAALVFAQLHVDGSGHDARPAAWAEYVTAAIEQVEGTDGPVGQWADFCHRDLLDAQIRAGHAVALYRRHLAACRNNRQHQAVPSALRAFATVLHADGQCETAVQKIRAAVHAWRHTADITAPSGLQLLRTYLSILAMCGLPDQGRTVLAENSDLFGSANSGLRDTVLRTTARRLRTIELGHRTVCRRRATSPVPPFGTDHDSFTYWYELFTTSPAVAA